MRIVGTRSAIATPSISLIDELAGSRSVAGVDIASAYWDAGAFGYALALAEAVAGPVRVVLWTAGGSRPAWEAAREVDPQGRVELRFIDSPEGGGIFHAKVAGAAGSDGTWLSALVGSGNLTDAALRRNVELGLVIHEPAEVLADLQSWFSLQFDAATPAGAIDWERALQVVPETSEAAVRRAIFAEAALAIPAPAGPIEPRRVNP